MRAPATESAERQVLAMRGSLARADATFRKGRGKVVFLGGSITNMNGWRQLVRADLVKRYPDTQFEFVNAGIPSMGTVAHAHRFTRDVIADRPPDLLFVEAAVNDLHNGKSYEHALRGMDGVLRQARATHPRMDVVVMHFADAPHTRDYLAGRVPAVIRAHELAADAHGAISLNLAFAVAEDIRAGKLDWRRDFKNVHPSPFGQGYYAERIAEVLDRALRADSGLPPQPSEPGPSVIRGSYAPASLRSPSAAKFSRRCHVVPRWTPTDGKRGRAGFVDVEVLEARGNGASFQLDFEGTGCGLWLNAGPESAILRWRVDGGAWSEELDTHTRWSQGLHLPHTYMLAESLSRGRHRLEVEVVPRARGRGGDVLRVVHFLVHG